MKKHHDVEIRECVDRVNLYTSVSYQESKFSDCSWIVFVRGVDPEYGHGLLERFRHIEGWRLFGNRT